VSTAKLLGLALIASTALTAAALLLQHPARVQERPSTLLNVGHVDWVNLTVLVDNNPDPQGRLTAAWGLSIYVETPNTCFLFDAGCSPEALKVNAEALGLDLSKVDFVVLSHEHWDHIAGLTYVAEVSPNCTVYAPAGMSKSAKNYVVKLGLHLVEVEGTLNIADGIVLLGQLYGPPYEQAVAINVSKLGLVLLVGCSHPGVEAFVEEASSQVKTKVCVVIGGLHLASAEPWKLEAVLQALVDQGVERIYPLHCSGASFRSLVQAKHPKLYGDGHVGLSVLLKGEGYIEGCSIPQATPVKS